MGFWSDYDKHKICYKCSEQRLDVLDKIENAYKPNFRVHKIDETVTQEMPIINTAIMDAAVAKIMNPVEEIEVRFDFIDEKKKELQERSAKYLKEVEEEVAKAQKLLQEAQVMNQKLKDLFKDK